MDPVPLFGGIPGGPELVVVFLILLLLFAVPLALVALGVVGGATLLGGSDDEELERLERRVDELESELAEERGDDEQ